VSREFPRLLQKSSAELAELLTDKEAFARFLHSTEGALEARAFTRELRLEIEGMCRANIEKAEEARDLRSQMSVIRSCDAQPVKDAYEAARKKADGEAGRGSGGWEDTTEGVHRQVRADEAFIPHGHGESRDCGAGACVAAAKRGTPAAAPSASRGSPAGE
jgi:hypothetical protein